MWGPRVRSAQLLSPGLVASAELAWRAGAYQGPGAGPGLTGTERLTSLAFALRVPRPGEGAQYLPCKSFRIAPKQVRPKGRAPPLPAPGDIFERISTQSSKFQKSLEADNLPQFLSSLLSRFQTLLLACVAAEVCGGALSSSQTAGVPGEPGER